MTYSTFWKTCLVFSGGAALAACTTPPPNANLIHARQVYSQVAADPMVKQSASHQLEDAKDSLDMAQHVYDDDKGMIWRNEDANRAEVDHYAYLAQRYSEVAQQTAKVRVAAVETTTAARVITLGDMQFATGKAELNSDGLKAVADLAAFLKSYPDRTVSIAGYTDSTGGDKINMPLSAARADAVRQALAADQVAPSRMTDTRGLGPANPVASNATARGRQQNRRVEITVGGPAAMNGSTTPVAAR